MAVGPLLMTCKSLASSPKMTAVSLHVTSLLWQRHDECFPYLIQMVSSSGRLSGVDRDECLLARATCLQDVCCLRPHQHGPDVLPFVSAILNECISHQQSAAACIALRALCLLCDAEHEQEYRTIIDICKFIECEYLPSKVEVVRLSVTAFKTVIDIRTTWAGLAKKLSFDKRPKLLAGLCQLLSTVSSHSVDTKDYEMFVSEVVDWLWRTTQHENEEVIMASFEALSKFPSSRFSLHHFPAAVVDETVKNSDADGDSDAEIPAVFYTRMLSNIPVRALPGFRMLLSSLVRQEASNLPKGINYSANCQITDDEQLNQRRLSAKQDETHVRSKQRVMNDNIAIFAVSER